jgi:hypothetical protein
LVDSLLFWPIRSGFGKIRLAGGLECGAVGARVQRLTAREIQSATHEKTSASFFVDLAELAKNNDPLSFDSGSAKPSSPIANAMLEVAVCLLEILGIE